MRAAFRSRIRIVLGILIVIGLLIVTRLYFVQVVDGSAYAEKADNQYAAAGGSLFDRGSIYFTTKDGTLVSAATLQDGFLVAINPQTMTDPQAAYAAVSAAASTTIPESQFLTDAANKQEVYVEVAHQLSESQGNALAAENVAGVELYKERWSYYPGGDIAANAIGYVAQVASDPDLKGRAGLEEEYDATLERSDDSLYQNFFAELFSNIGNTLMSAQDTREGNLITTIEPEVETRLADDLAAVNAKYSSQQSGGIIMVPSTGAIIALASYPTFDPNDFQDASPSALGDPLVQSVFEFGSTMKPLTMEAGLDAGVITASTTYDDTGCITVNASKICNFDLKARGVIPMVEILDQSLNVGASWIATQLGQATFRKYFTELFGQKTGVDLPSEAGALIGNLSAPEQVDYDTASFGQGIAVTPMQMIRALDTIPDAGLMPTPHIGAAIQLDTGVEKTLTYPAPVRVFGAAAATTVANMLVSVFPPDERLALNSDPTIQIPDVPVAAKTGTAQVINPNGGYYTDVFFHSFYGFFPAYNPQFLIVLYTNRPQGVEYASGTLTPTFMDLTNFLIDYYNIPPDPAQVPPVPKTVVE
jgi:cell division protein FtsI (penicillin-binding protein 3)/stage V sporulation protein D (sporulation-specific penicillin-binding protein)